MIPDPMSNFYDALCVGIDWFENLNTTDAFFQQSPDNSGWLNEYLRFNLKQIHFRDKRKTLTCLCRR